MSDRTKGTDDSTTVPGIRDVFATTLETVTGEIAASTRGAGLTGAPLLAAVANVVDGAVRGAVAMGSDLAPAMKAIIMGILRGTEAKEEAGLKILSHAAKIIIRQTADRGGNLAAATKGIVLGAIASAKSIGVDVPKAASTAAQGAHEGAVEAGSLTVEQVLGALKEPIGGSKVALPMPAAT